MLGQNTFSYIDIDGELKTNTVSNILLSSDKSIIYFYPKNDTPGCTLENKDFSCLSEEFRKKGIQLIGVSKDSVESHSNFREKYNLNILQISDPELKIHNHFGAYGEKNNYGKIVLGVIRSTFLVDSYGTILKSWQNVKAKGHAEKVLREIH